MLTLKRNVTAKEIWSGAFFGYSENYVLLEAGQKVEPISSNEYSVEVNLGRVGAWFISRSAFENDALI